MSPRGVIGLLCFCRSPNTPPRCTLSHYSTPAIHPSSVADEMAATTPTPPGTDERHVAEAALAMVRPTTDAATRRRASRFLEEWTQRPEAYGVYVQWLASHRHQRGRDVAAAGIGGVPSGPADADQVAMQLLCLTMLQSKLRREVRRDRPDAWHPGVATLREELWEYLRQPGLDKALRGPCCVCNAAVIVRCGLLGEFMTHLRTNDGTNHDDDGGSGVLSKETALRLLACIPSEMEACQDLTTSQVTGDLQVHLEIVLNTIQKGLAAGGEISTTRLTACQALKSWAEISHVSLSQLNTPTCGGSNAVLPTLISLLSSSSSSSSSFVSMAGSSPALSPNNAHLPYDELTLQVASRALTDAILVVSDHCTPTRDAAALVFWRAISEQGFIIHPLQVAAYNNWHDASHALASLLSTFAVEQVDDLVAQPADIGMQVLLDIQKHPHTPVALVPLECWLTIQEIPMSERHEHWKRPLYRQLVETLVARLAYPQNFTTWEDELEVDSSEFFELRRLVSDILVSCYYLLRVEMIQMLIYQTRTASHWTVSEAALFGLRTISKEVCSRCKSNAAPGTMVASDRQATSQELLHLLDRLVAVNIATTQGEQPLLLAAVINFCGAYSPAWHSMDCPPQGIFHLLAYLQSAFGALPMEAAKATRAIYVSCLAKSMPNLEDFHSAGASGEVASSSQFVVPMVLKSVRNSMEAVLLTTDEEAMTTVAEGATRLVTTLVNPAVARESLKTDLIRPVHNSVESAMQSLPPSNNTAMEAWMSPHAEAGLDMLERYLSVIQVIARFCDSPHVPAMGEWLLQELGPCLDLIQRRTASTPAQPRLLPKWILIHQQILRSTLHQEGSMIATFTNTVPIVVQALEQTQDPSTLRYISTAVEMFGGKTPEMDQSFQDLLSHITTIITSRGHLLEATELFQAYFECLQRFILYCPRALCFNSQFTAIVSLSVDSIPALQAKEAARAALLFLSQLFGWNTLRLSPQTHNIMQEAWNVVVKHTLLTHGPILTQVCVSGLAGGSQVLWPAYSDCLFAIVQAVVLNQLQEEHEQMPDPAADAYTSSMLNESHVRHWLYSSMIVHLEYDENADNGVRSRLTAETCNQMISFLLSLARQGPKARPKAKMLLTDFAKIKKGEMGIDSLMSYTLP